MYTSIRKWCQKPTQVMFLIFLIQGLWHTPAAMAESNAVPASIFRHSYLTDISKHHQRYSVENTIFNPIFVNYILALSYSEDNLGIEDIQSAVERWNNIASSKKRMIEFNAEHFTRFAALSNNNENSCRAGSTACSIDKQDLRILFRWLRWRETLLIGEKFEGDMSRRELLSMNPEKDDTLHATLFKLSRDTTGRLLLENALKRNVKIHVASLDGMHGYYEYQNNKIVIDPSVIRNEFNLRYLAHELVHVLNHDNTNSIMEEVIAELIGLDVQNSITGIRMHEHPYNVFISRLLHPHYGQLMINNHIESYLHNAGMKYAFE